MVDARDGVAREIERQGIKQVVVAKRAGLTEMQLSGIVSKRRKMDANEMFDICRALNITPNDLFADDQDAS